VAFWSSGKPERLILDKSGVLNGKIDYALVTKKSRGYSFESTRLRAMETTDAL